jgi:integrase
MEMLLHEYAGALATKDVRTITADDVEAAVRKAPQRRRTLRAIRQVLYLAISRNLCTTNPADPNIMKYRLPIKQEEQPHAAMDYTELPAFFQRLRSQPAHVRSARVVQFLILTAARSGEVTDMRWSELNRETKVWTIPPNEDRTNKTNRGHRVPLAEQAMALLNQQSHDGDYVWGNRFDKPIGPKAPYRYLTRYLGIPLTIHGFRSSFSSWCFDQGIPEELTEKCLSHKPNRLVGAYRRSDALELRREIMEKWTDFCYSAS